MCYETYIKRCLPLTVTHNKDVTPDTAPVVCVKTMVITSMGMTSLLGVTGTNTDPGTALQSTLTKPLNYNKTDYFIFDFISYGGLFHE